MTPTRDHAIRILELLSYGLVKGKGIPIPGNMCVEAAVCLALGLPHGDNPPCVGSEVRKFKIELNDNDWTTTIARARGMRELAIAQLGSDKLDQRAFKDLIWFKFGTQIQPLIWHYLATKAGKAKRLEFADKMEHSKTLEECLAHAYAHAHTHAHAHDYAHAYDYAHTHASVLKELNSPGCQWLDLCK